MKTRITELLGIEYPIFQGGMAWVSTPELAAAVSEAGGLGILACGMLTPEEMERRISRCRELTSRPFGMNIVMLSPHVPQLAELAARERLAAVTTGAGNPGQYIGLWKDAGVKVLPVIPSVALALRMERAGADGVIAEGTESGGHVGETTTLTLVPQVADALSIPVVAAGGIADGRGVAAAFMLGAEAVQCGTRFIASTECVAHQNYKDMIVSAGDTDTAVTGRSIRRPVRAIRNALTRRYVELEQQGAGPDELEALALGALGKAFAEGDREAGSFMAGQISGLIHGIMPVREIIEDMFRQAGEIYWLEERYFRQA